MNANGEVVGINTVKVTTAEGIGFAIPINIAKPVINSFINKGKFDEPYLGLFAYDKEVMPYVDPTINVDGGVYAAKIDTAGPAAAAGIKVGDIIKRVDGTNVRTMADLRTLVHGKAPYSAIAMTVYSNGYEKVVNVVLGKKSRDGMVTR